MSVPAPGTALLCPSCHATVAAGSRFCGQCGSPIGPAAASSAAAPAPAPAAAPARPVDIRQKVEADRGALKRLQLMIPGFRGYREGEDIRDADSILRREVADKLVDALAQLQKVRQSLVQANQYAGLNDLALLLSDLTTLEGRIRHAEQGYSGISATIRIQAKDLDRLYEYDYGFALAADQFRAQVPAVAGAAQGGDAAALRASLDQLRSLLGQLTNAFQARMTTIEGIAI